MKLEHRVLMIWLGAIIFGSSVAIGIMATPSSETLSSRNTNSNVEATFNCGSTFARTHRTIRAMSEVASGAINETCNDALANRQIQAAAGGAVAALLAAIAIHIAIRPRLQELTGRFEPRVIPAWDEPANTSRTGPLALEHERT